MGFKHSQRTLAALDGQIDGHLGDLIDMGLEPVGVGPLFNDPIGDGFQLIQPGAGAGVKFQDTVFALPKVLHTGQALEDKAYIAGQFLMDAVNGLGYFFRLFRLVDLDDPVGPLGAVLLIEFAENRRPVALAMGEAIQNSELRIFGQRPQFFHKGLG